MSYFGKMLRKIRLERGLRQSDIAEALGVAKGTISMYESGQRSPSFETAEHIADILNVPLASLIESPVPRSVAPSRFISPDFSRIEQQTVVAKLTNQSESADGPPSIINVNVAADNRIPCDFAITVTRNCLSNSRFHDGDIVFIRAQEEVEDGQIALVAIENEITLRRVYHTRVGLVFVTENPNYPPLIFVPEESDKYHILGKAVAFQSAL